MKYHVGEDLIPRQCRATLRDCPYKIERHFSTFKEAQEYADILGEKSNTKMSRDTAEFYANIHQKILKIFPYATQEDGDDITVECQKHNGNNRTLEMLLGHQISIRKDILFGGNFRSYFGATMMNDTEAQDLLFFSEMFSYRFKRKIL